MKQIFYIFLSILIAIPLVQPGGGLANAQTTYYVAAAGNDANPGTQAQPWLTPMRAEYAKLNPGDSVLFKRGDVFEGGIFDTLIGTWANPIVIGAYGSGPRPIFYGDLRGRTWTPTPGHPNIYQCYVGAGSDFQNGYKQYYNGAWTNSSGVNYRNAFPAEWGTWWTAMATPGCLGISVDDDTLFVHLYGDAAGLGHDSLRCYRFAGLQIVHPSKGYYIRDLDLRDNYLGIVSWGDSARIRNVHTQMSITDGMAYEIATTSICDSCQIDSTGDTGFYFVSALRCVLKNSVITNTGLTPIDGIPSGGIDRAGIGILDHHNASQTGYGYNTIDSNTVYNDFSGTLDFFYCIGDTFRYNVSHAAGGGAFPAGNNLVLSHNSFTMKPAGADGMNCGQYRNGNITITYNTLDSVKDYGIQISENDSSGTFTVNNNTINMIIPARDFINYSVSGITSTNNHFNGTGDRFTLNGVNYNSLAAFHAATGFENGSTPLVAFSSNVNQIDFGGYKLGQFKDTLITITNKGGDTLKIAGDTLTNNAFTLTPALTQKNIAYDSVLAETIRFTPVSFGTYKGSIVVKSNDPLGPDTIKLTGTSPYPTIAVNLPSLNFGNVVRNTPKPLTIQITNSSINTLSVDSLYTKTSLFAVNKTRDSVATIDSVVITFTPAAFGNFTDTLYLRNNSTSPLVKVPLSGISPAPTLGLNHSSLNFGNVGRDSSKQQMLQISNSTVNILSVDSLYTTSSVFKVGRTNISVATVDSFAVTFSPLVVGLFTDTLYLRNNSASALVKVPLTGNCPSPLIITSSSGILFPDRALQDSAVITVSARNASVVPLTISNITTTSGVFSVSPKTTGISAGDSVALRLVFKPVLFGAVIDTMTVISDAGVVRVPLSGASPYPVISVNKSAIDFGLVAANDSNYQGVVFRNASINKLRIDSIYTTNAIFVVPIHNATITDSLSSLILCYSKNAGVFGDTLYLKNNSVTPLLKVPIAAKLYSKPGRPQSARISPNHWTKTAMDTVAWTISQNGMLPVPRAWYSLDTLPRLSSTLLSQPVANNSFVLSMNKVGAHTVYFYLEDSLGNKNPDSAGSVVARFDTTAPTIQDVTKSDTVIVQQDGSINSVPPITASAVKAPNQAGVASMKLNYRRINDDTTASLAFPGFNNSSLMLPGSVFKIGVTTIGVDYQIQAADSAGNTSISDFYSFIMRLAPGAAVTNPLEIPSASALPADQEVKAYRIFSMPYDLDNKKPSSFMETSFGSNAENGTANVRWRMQRLVDTTWEDYDTFKDSLVVAPGSAFFLISRDPQKSIVVSNAQLVRSDVMSTQGVPLNKGWNLLGNPFLVNIPFARLSFVGGNPLARYYYSGTGPLGGWESSGADVDTLRTWQGWAINMDSACTMKINFPNAVLPPSAKRSVHEEKTATNTDTTKEWTLQISASRSDIQMSYTGAEIGMNSRSAKGFDKNDRLNPPFIGSRSISVGFNNDAGPLLKDMRPVSNDGDTWDLTVTTGDANAKATLRFDAVEKIPNTSFTVCLLDAVKGLAYDLKNQNSIDVVTGKEGFRNYRVLIGTKAFVEKNLNGIALLPNDPQLYPNYPNPFNPATTIRYAVPNSGNRFKVELKVYNVLGQEVQTLVKDEKEPGFYEVSFDGGRLASGVYFYRIVISGGGTNFNNTKKMLLIK